MSNAFDSNVFYLGESFGTDEFARIESWVGRDISQAIRFDEHLLPNRLIAGEITALYGEPKVGKSHVAINCALMAAIGGTFWDEYFPADGCPVVYVAAERVEQAAQRILASCLSIGLEEIPENLILVHGKIGLRLGDVATMDELKRLIESVNPRLVIFDTYANMVDNDEDKAADAERNVQTLTKLLRASSQPCAGVLVHHAGKDPSKKMRGSTALQAAVTTVWKVVKPKKTGCITLSMEDANAFAAPEACHFTIETVNIPSKPGSFDSQNVGIAVSTKEPFKLSERPERILKILREDSRDEWRIEEIVSAVARGGEKLSKSTIDREIGQLVEQEVLERNRISKANVYRISPTR